MLPVTRLATGVVGAFSNPRSRRALGRFRLSLTETQRSYSALSVISGQHKEVVKVLVSALEDTRDDNDGTGDQEGPGGAPGPESNQQEQIIEDQDNSMLSGDMGADMKPREMVEALDNYIVGQANAKRAIAIALRNRWRRQQLTSDLRNEVVPKNILMIGPTGCGKTEIARRIAKLCNAPFVKVEATKFTEVGFHGRDVDQIVRDLADAAVVMTKQRKRQELRAAARAKAEQQVVERLVGGTAGGGGGGGGAAEQDHQDWLDLVRRGELDSHKIDVEVPQEQPGPPMGMDPGMSDIVQRMMVFKAGPTKKTRRKMTIKEALPLLEEAELDGMVDEKALQVEALKAAADSGIVFIDEIDKICSKPGSYSGPDASSEGVQRDLLPLIEGCTINTKYGNVDTDFILFVASGAFHSCKPSDLMAELQGRLPIRVELNPLSEDDLYRILTEPKPNLIRQYTEMMAVEKVKLIFEEEAIREIASVAAEVNRTVENIGARRLQTILERVVEDISFTASDNAPGTEIVITKDTVRQHVTDLMVKSDMSKYIL
uniref:AAA+ ATPase domain-containing protein n=1 Tax=Heterosigma akashiwo TaxID=2829 RepID=A0A7S3UVW0_HETAK|mmetsp:Transcript_11942/g.18536  ORF Transcript_11942/g.18536 Transcript_11942/m.18536 type:complete len:544 (+) Transcript_11942:109-1740(+)